jgi:pimeloyl-ACP methyl ester carboxylesterase
MLNIVLLPGLACDAGLFRDQLPALAQAGWLHVSTVHTRHASLPAMAQALLAETAGPLVLVGSSMGGMLALQAQALAPQRVQALALLSTTARPDTPEMQQLRREAIVQFRAGQAEAVLRANAGFAFHAGQAPGAAAVDDYVANILQAGVAQLIAQNQAVAERPDLRPVLARVRCPVLVACGEGDVLTPPALSEELVAGMPHARSRLQLVPGAGHLLTWEQPAALNAVLLDWLATLA